MENKDEKDVVNKTESIEPIKEETKSEEKVEKEPEVIETKKETKKESKGLAIAAMVLGIIALVFFCAWPISIPCAILAIIFGAVQIKKAGRGMAIAGLVMGIISIAIWVILIATGVTIFNAAYKDGTLNNFLEELEEIDSHNYNYNFRYKYDL